MVHYVTLERVEELNLLALTVIAVKKSDKPDLVSRSKLQDALDQCEEVQGDVYLKAAVLLQQIIKQHPFASGNRRTAFLSAKQFCLLNNKPFKIPDDPSSARVMQGIRENHYSLDEISEWIKNGKIKPFKR